MKPKPRTIEVSEETHGALCFVRRRLQAETGRDVSFDECIAVLAEIALAAVVPVLT